MKKQVFIMLSLVAVLGTAMTLPDTVGAAEVITESTEDETNSAGENIDPETGLVIPALKDWDYTKDDANKIILIKDYNGRDSKIKVPATYMINGTKYKVQFTLKCKDELNEEGVFAKRNLLEEVFFEDGITGDFRYLFRYCKNLKKANIPAGVTDCTSMFEQCTSLVEAPAIPSGVKKCKSMFLGCSSLTEAPAIPSGVVDCSAMFCNCGALVKAPVIPSGVEKCQLMFGHCTSLVEAPVIPLKVTDTCQMFSGCSALVKAPDIPESVEDARAMFENCAKLSGSMEISGRIQRLYFWYYAGQVHNIGMFEEAATEGDGLIIYYADGVNIDEILEAKSANSKITAKPLSEKPAPTPVTPTPDAPKPGDPKPATPSGTKIAAYNGDTFYRGADGKVRCYDKNGKLVTNQFKFDGSYTYYMQADGTSMTDRLTYHPDGEHIIYFDAEGHEVFTNFHYCPSVGYTCYFDSNGYLYKDQITFVGDKVYYLNANGAMEQNGWFQFANGLDYGFANSDGTLITSGFSYDPYGRVVFYHWNGMVARGLITDGIYYYNMDMTDGHYLGQFPVQ